MDATYRTLKNHTHQIAAAYPDPVFYRRHSRENDYSTDFFNNNRLILSIRTFVTGPLSENLGHGFEHAAKVTVDAGTLLLIEGKLAGYSKFHLDRQLLLVQSAGLLHDISRTEKNHAQKGAVKAREYLLDYPFTDRELDDICTAIHNHEAFKDTVSPPTRMGTLISDCLYDADKFRWSADNLSHTLWDMLHFGKVPVSADPRWDHRAGQGLCADLGRR